MPVACATNIDQQNTKRKKEMTNEIEILQLILYSKTKKLALNEENSLTPQ